MNKVYFDTLQWNQWPITLVISSSGLQMLEFSTPQRLQFHEADRRPGIRFIHDGKALDPYLSQLREYFNGERRQFDMPLDLKGTAFQLRVWQFLQSIPYGQVASYQEAAFAAGNGKAVRAAGMANNRNPVSVVVPCHRVVGKNGRLVGYGGGLDLKESLLMLEGVGVRDGRITEDAAWMKNH
ncbi:MAG: methylated-DNA--[protein]-cysteine S-methyltransferase [Bacillota bacterium]|nr:methylated-DNA--[protein]-cysteine S-methyltransferase [Bacillota bacterium]